MSQQNESLATTHINAAVASLEAARIELSRMRRTAEVLLVTDAGLRSLLADWSRVSKEMRDMPGREHLYGSDTTPELEAAWTVLCNRRSAIEAKLHAIADECARAEVSPTITTSDVLAQIIRETAA